MARSVFLHSTGTGPALWARVPPEITEGTDRLLVSNLGYAPNPPVPRGEVVTLSDEVDHALAAIGDPTAPLDVRAHSYGATIALALIGRANIRSLFLVEPVLFGALARVPVEPAVQAELASFLTDPWFLDDAERGGTEEWLSLFVDYWNRPGAFAGMPEPLRAAQRALGWKMFQEVRACFYGMDAFPVVPPEIPLTLALGERTTASSKAMTRALAEIHPQARVIVLPGTGHMAPLTHPERVFAAMRA
ncbi:MAG: alpha/beta hydrolase [Deltaproteobacteria bacterium]|nr:alpha/beta hydrolase [Deltaproteobacteria bacterium]